MKAKRAILIGTALAALLSSGAAWADVKAGVDAWSRGDYATAVHDWEGPAAAGDPDAMFNLGQAYRLGRGVPQDSAKAEGFYARAAAKGHLQAADTYGLMLFQDGRREAALPYIEDAVRRGDPRAEYILGIAAFNGDAVPKDWVKAYALVTLANEHDLPQAAVALAQMDKFIPLDQRQQAAGMAVQMEDQADAARGRELASADLAARAGTPASPQSALPSAPTAVGSRVPYPLATLAVSPSVEAAREAVTEAREATVTASPAGAGASFARQAPPALHIAEARAAAKPKPIATAVAPTPMPKAATSATAAGEWRVQLGAFAIHSNADKLWAELKDRSELAGKTELKVPAGRMVELQAGGFATRDAAENACRSLKRAGHVCLVTQ